MKLIYPELNAQAPIYEIEVKWLTRFREYDWCPNILFTSPCIIVMNNCGERLTRDNAPANIENQMLKILDTLRILGCCHNDIKPENILIKDSKAVLIDYGWSTPGEAPANYPKILGGEFRGDNGIDDYESLDKVMDWLKKVPTLSE